MQYATSGSAWWRREPVPTVAAGPGGPAVAAEPFEGVWAARALVTFTVMLVLAPQQYLPILGTLRIALLVGAGAIAAYVFGKSSERPLPASTEFKIVMVLAGWAVLSVPTAIWPGGAFDTIMDKFSKSVAVFWLLGRVINSVSRFRALAWTLAITSVPLAVTGVMNYRSGELNLGRVVTYGGGLASNANDLAITLNLFLPITVALALTARSRVMRLAAWGMATIAAAGVVVSFSRQGFLALALEAALILLLLMRRHFVASVAALVFIVVGAAVAVPSEYRDRMSTIFNAEADETGSSQLRIEDNQVALEFIGTHPIIGGGIGQDVLALNSVRVHWTRIHNTYLSFAVDLGLPGLCLFVALLVTSYRSVRRVERAARTGLTAELGSLAAGVRIGLVGFIATAFFAPVPYNFYLYYIAGLVVALKTISARQFATVL